MEYINGVSNLYIRKFPLKVKQYNKMSHLPDYFGPLIGDKTFVRIAEVGAGPVNTIGTYWDNCKVELVASDILAEEYRDLWDQHPEYRQWVPIEYQDMENLTYEDESFDIVHCVNALDHTEDAGKAIDELIRICKKGGWIYFRHSPDQQKRFGGNHHWNVGYSELDGVGVSTFTDKDGDYWYVSNEFGKQAAGAGDDQIFKTHLEGDLIVSICHKT